MSSEDEFDAITRPALRSISYFVIFLSALLVIPYPIWLVLVANSKSFNRDAFVQFAQVLFVISMTGQLLIWLGWIVVSAAAMWTYKKTQDHDAKFAVLRRGSLRLLPAFIWLLITFLYAARRTSQNEFFVVPALGGVVLFGYGYYLLTLDRTSAAVE